MSVLLLQEPTTHTETVDSLVVPAAARGDAHTCRPSKSAAAVTTQGAVGRWPHGVGSASHLLSHVGAAAADLVDEVPSDRWRLNNVQFGSSTMCRKLHLEPHLGSMPRHTSLGFAAFSSSAP
eukprot:1903268-Prymnesium_polylepis.1